MPSLYTRTSGNRREHASPPKLLMAVGKGCPLLAGRRGLPFVDGNIRLPAGRHVRGSKRSKLGLDT